MNIFSLFAAKPTRKPANDRLAYIERLPYRKRIAELWRLADEAQARADAWETFIKRNEQSVKDFDEHLKKHGIRINGVSYVFE